MNLDLFDTLPFDALPAGLEKIGEQSVVLRQFAVLRAQELIRAVEKIAVQAPFRHMLTPGGYRMSAAMTNCGLLGWVTDRNGYRYQKFDPLTSKLWPAMPELLIRLAVEAASLAGFDDFQPDACLINEYAIAAKMSLHQDKNEKDLSQPVVSVSLGMTATFLFGGLERQDKIQKIVLRHGDVVVWGGLDRLRYHGILPLKEQWHPQLGQRRINLTFRQAG